MMATLSLLPTSPVPLHSSSLPRRPILLKPLRPHRLRCRCSGNTRFPGQGENDNKAVLDAFFLGKAFAEALNERVESTVGEILSVVGQWQAEQQKQVVDFQEEVRERAKKAKEKAAKEAIGTQRLTPESSSSSSGTQTSTVVTPETNSSGNVFSDM